MRARFSYILVAATTAAALAACGDNGAKPDAAPHVDGEVDQDAPVDSFVFLDGSGSGSAIDGGSAVDAGIDAPGDGSSAKVSGIWAMGDFATNGVQVASRFASTDTLPITAPTVGAPGGAATLATGTNFTQFVFDVTPDGTRTAFVADLTTVGTFDLYVADQDGANPVLLVPGQAGVEISSILLSPDGSKVAYTSDSVALNNAFDLFVVNTAGTPVPVQVSPLRPVGTVTPSTLNVFSQFSWSADSKLVGFSADLEVDKLSGAYIVDTSAAVPVVVQALAAADIKAPSVGVRGTLQFDASDNAFFRASVDGTAQFKLFTATSAGVRTDLTSILPLRGDNSIPDVGALGISHDGATLVFSSDAPTALAYDLYSAATAMPMPTKLTNLAAAGEANFNLPLFFSPDDSAIAYIATFATAGVNEPEVTKLDGSDTHRLFAITVTNADTEWLQWSADGTQVYTQGDLEVNNDTKLYVLDPTLTDQPLTLAVDVATGGDVQNVIVRPLVP